MKEVGEAGSIHGLWFHLWLIVNGEALGIVGIGQQRLIR